jgi:hypothetical protein
MTRIVSGAKNDEGQFEITDAGGKVVEGPFETNASAWRALERLDDTSYDGLNRNGSRRKRARVEKATMPQNPRRRSRSAR